MVRSKCPGLCSGSATSLCVRERVTQFLYAPVFSALYNGVTRSWWNCCHGIKVPDTQEVLHMC